MTSKQKTSQPGKKKPANPKWLIMAYINVDGWKANFAIESLKQLKAGASAEVVVAAQLGVEMSDPEYTDKYRRYIFDGKTAATTSISDDRIEWNAPPDTNMAAPKTVTEFIEWARKERQAGRYCLVLWMDGVLPLYEPLARRKVGDLPATHHEKSANGGKRIRYIQPYELRQALESAHLDDSKRSKGQKKFEIVAMDACSMSMVEYAYELKDVAEYLVASEEAVPYWSFPYRSILEHFRRSKAKKDVAAICKAITREYTTAYQDCVCSLETGIRPVMLSALRLGDKGIEAIADPLNNLARLLQVGATNGHSKLSTAILEARRNSQDFAFGTFVDLADFCDNLGRDEDASSKIQQACVQICKVVREKFVKANEVAPRDKSKSCTGAMIYFPYFKESQQQDKIDVVLDKGVGSSSGEGGLGKSAAAVSIATRGSHYALRQEVIKDIENYYRDPNFNFGQATEWYKFIRCVWSPILAQEDPWLLDLRYSAEQCAANLVNGSKRGMERRTET